MNAIYAEENFRWGVMAFHNGFFNKAILSFEKSLSYKADNFLTRQWLGLAFYQSGLEEQALREWNFLVQKEKAPRLLKQWLDILAYRRSPAAGLKKETRYIITTEIDAQSSAYYQFRRPATIHARPDGTFYLTAFATNEILKIDSNRVVDKIIRGDLIQGLDHPFDILELEDNSYFVSEYLGHRITRFHANGFKDYSFGGKGTKEGHFLGPQYLALDKKGYLYVSDIGNKRVQKFNLKGEFILSFGQKKDNFPGFSEPTGMAVQDDRIFVADRKRKSLFVFDLSGNFLYPLVNEKLTAPEGLTLQNDNVLLIADTDDVLTLDIENEHLQPISDLSTYAKRLTSVSIDANNNVLACDFDLSKVFFLTEMTNLYTGLFVQINHIVADKFPEVVLDVSVTDMAGNPVVGLDKSNFFITESSQPVKNYELLLTNQQTEFMTVVLLIEKSLQAKENVEMLKGALDTLYSLFAKKATVLVVSADENAKVEISESSTRLKVIQAGTATNFSPAWRLDAGIREAVSALLKYRGRKSIIYLSQGGLGKVPYQDYSLMELAQYIKNNHITLHTVYFNAAELHQDIRYLTTITNGSLQYYFQSQGLNHLPSTILNDIPAVYTLKFYSLKQPDFGRKYLEVEAEVTLQNRKGRGECGYYTNLKF